MTETDQKSVLDEFRQRLSVKSLKRAPIRYYVGGLFILGLAVAPVGLTTLQVLKMSAALFFVMFVISWDFVSGYTGLVSFGHTLFFATGGYSAAILNLEYGVHPALGIVAGVVLAGIMGLLYGIPALRIEGHYLALFTLLPPLILLRVFRLFRETLGGDSGLTNPEALIQGSTFTETALLNYYLTFVLFLVIFSFAWIVTRSDTGVIFTAIRENEDAVASAGLNPVKYKLYAFIASAAMGGLAGAVFVHTPAGSPSPSQLLALSVMIEILLAGILGGFGTITGGVAGGLAIYWVMDWFQGTEMIIPGTEIAIGEISMLLFFIILLAVLMTLREGALPWSYRQGGRLLARFRRGDSAVTDGGRAPLDRTLASLREATSGHGDEEREEEKRT